MIYQTGSSPEIEALFDGWEDTMIYSCLQGVMGQIYTDSLTRPEAAMAILGDFCFFAGRPERELVLSVFEVCGRDFMILTPRTGEWEKLIEECYGECAERVVRYAIKKEPEVFDAVRLRRLAAALPDGYAMRRMDEELFLQCRQLAWCRDWVSQYPDYAAYRRHGLGVVILKGDEPVSGASSYSGYNGGIEIEIDTREDHRRRGLACACGAELILECLERGLYPSWDAQNRWSVALAEKLGYHFDREYTAYEVRAEHKEG
ncbi:MAG: GNAT family N-acetyltransferase [Lachnospiraceae bacterium]|nr:GNAT family N-acetyltransferase [Lachnospiraceae bacterium]